MNMKRILSGLTFSLLLNQAWSSPVADASTNPSGADATPMATFSRQAERPVIHAADNHFTGAVHVAPLFAATPTSHVSGAYVTFEPGAHTAWHTHPAGQRLIVTAGSGYIQFWGGPIQRIAVGDVVWIPAGQKHWHGASATAAMTHLAIQEEVDGKTVNWMEKVTSAQYGIADSKTNSARPMERPSRAQQLMGDITPKLAELTDRVLYQDIWERPGLSKRDRSLVTVSALIALNRPDQLRSHLALALTNGVTEEELTETITQLAFYAGWPSAVAAVPVAREVFQNKASHSDPGK